MITVTIYTRQDCPDCEQVIRELDELQATIPHKLIKLNTDGDPHLTERFGATLPVVEIGPYRLRFPFQSQELRIMLSAANDRVTQLETVDRDGYQKLLDKGHQMTFGDKLSFFLSRHYLFMVNVFLLLYTGLPFLAPVLMKNNLELPANLIYRVYGTVCHQLAFRSFFLFGEQTIYPRALANIKNVVSYERMMNIETLDLIQARNFIGNELVGFKVALCERDVAIYGSMLLFGLIYGFVDRRFLKINWIAWIIIGLVPIGVDGVSQIPSLTQGLPGWLPIRESTPFLRLLTGGLFGWMTAWYLYPMIEETMRETRQILQRKQSVVDQIRVN